MNKFSRIKWNPYTFTIVILVIIFGSLSFMVHTYSMSVIVNAYAVTELSHRCEVDTPEVKITGQCTSLRDIPRNITNLTMEYILKDERSK